MLTLPGVVRVPSFVQSSSRDSDKGVVGEGVARGRAQAERYLQSSSSDA